MRNKEIDFLRGIAILLIIIGHSAYIMPINYGGWIGVDLFFVLSGFLIGGLLFDEYKKHGNIKIGLFLIRRGFKIYPSYYLLVATVTLKLYLVSQKTGGEFFPVKKFLATLFFLQNYLGTIWGPTWSLAVEEHFYLLLPLCLLWLIKFNKLKTPGPISGLFIGLALLCLALRICTIYFIGPWFEIVGFPTHLRIDSLFFGVLIAWFYHFRQTELKAFYMRYRKGLLIFAIPTFLQFFIRTDKFLPFFRTYLDLSVGFTVAFIVSGIFIIALVLDEKVSSTVKKIIRPPVFNFIAFTGYYSYNLYLWHFWLVDGIIVNDELKNYPVFKAWPVILPAAYFLLSYILGIGITQLVELPLLKLRDRLFPRRSKAVLPL